MLKDMNKDGRALKGDNYEGYDVFNNNAENGLCVYLKFNDEEYEICTFVKDNHILESIIIINEEAQKLGDSFGEYLYINSPKFKSIYKYEKLVDKVIEVLRKEKYITEYIEENYNILLKEAKNKNIYNFCLKYPLKRLKEKIKNKDFEDNQTVIAILEFGNLDIELSVWNYDDKFFLEYNICVKHIDEWESYSEIDKKITSIDNLEEDMFNELMIFSKKHKLYWSTFNN